MRPSLLLPSTFLPKAYPQAAQHSMSSSSQVGPGQLLHFYSAYCWNIRHFPVHEALHCSMLFCCVMKERICLPCRDLHTQMTPATSQTLLPAMHHGYVPPALTHIHDGNMRLTLRTSLVAWSTCSDYACILTPGCTAWGMVLVTMPDLGSSMPCARAGGAHSPACVCMAPQGCIASQALLPGFLAVAVHSVVYGCGM